MANTTVNYVRQIEEGITVAKNKDNSGAAVMDAPVATQNFVLTYRRDHPKNRSSYGIDGNSGIVVFDRALLAGSDAPGWTPPATITLNVELVPVKSSGREAKDAERAARAAEKAVKAEARLKAQQERAEAQKRKAQEALEKAQARAKAAEVKAAADAAAKETPAEQ